MKTAIDLTKISLKDAKQSSKISLKDAKQSSTKPPHSDFDCCTAEKALDGDPNSFTHSDEPNIGEYWDASFKEGE